MNREQGAKFTKDKLLLLVFLKFKLIVDSIPKLKDYVVSFKLHVETADSFKDDQLINIKGYAEKKQNAKEESVKGAMVMSGFIYAFAYDKGETVLQREMDLVKTSFEQKGEISLTLLRRVRSLASTNKLELADYGMTDLMLSEYSANVDAFELEMNTSKSAIGHRKFDTEGLDSELTAADVIIENSIERVMRHFETTNPEFFSEFTSANKDVILGSHQTRNPATPMGNFKMVIRDKNTLDLVAEALVKIDLDEEVYLYNSTKLNIIEEPIGTINGNVMSPNHKPTAFTGVITGDAQTIEVLMEPLI
ncbi:MAG: hypothetical protein WCL51_11075 [Bacteroidota bacterium]